MNPQNHVSRGTSLAILGTESVAAGRSREEWLAKQTNGNARIIELVGAPAADVR
ncbi:hypothetical protein [Sorangium sp. So ce406]|uniref:hypothetical protein n=1 Tax=Sorangium sp. So ce406 TaxID=3133311 RepID=UPI003F5CA954